jgi:hypothetical protein
MPTDPPTPHPPGQIHGDHITGTVGDEPGTLSFLSHALRETWERRRANVLTLSGYLAAGGVKGAIAATAEELWRRFTGAEQTAARAILLELTELGQREGDRQRTPDTRRRLHPRHPQPHLAGMATIPPRPALPPHLPRPPRPSQRAAEALAQRE